MKKKASLLLIFILMIGSRIWAQDFGFGFGFSEDEEQESSGVNYALSAGRTPSVSISGEVSAAIIGYFDEMARGAQDIITRDMFMFSGKLNFSARSSFAEGVINLKLVPALVPVSIDEAYIRAYFGSFEISAGLRKLSWGKADQMGPLDIINLPDSSKIFIEMADNTSLMGVKIANPVIHASYRFGMFSKIEVALLPSFEIISMAMESALGGTNPYLSMITGPVSQRWIPSGMRNLTTGINLFLKANPTNNIDDILIMPDTSGLNYAQAGLRFTTTIASADVGAQYFYGRLYQPAVIVGPTFMSNPASPSSEPVEFLFNKYHQIGIDYAQVLFGFNLRAEVAANITEDTRGDDGRVYNPSVGWSFGFDRDIFAGVNLNMQANGSVRLFNSRVGSANPFDSNYDIEGGTSMSSTRLTTMLSKKFLRDELELRAAVVWGIEDKDAAIIPALVWSRDDLRAAISGGFFLGDSNGQLGQYRDNNFLKLSVTYVF